MRTTEGKDTAYNMADIFNPQKRSEIMSRIKSKDTKAELIVFGYLRKEKIYFQKHYKKVAGSPDVALPRKKKAIFIDGDFWHGRTLEALIKRRGDPNDYWVLKIKRNIERDDQQRTDLIKKGWAIMRVWEDDILRRRSREATLLLVKQFLKLS